MNIVFLRSNPVDPDSRVEKAVNSLVKSGHSVKILAWDRNEDYDNKKTILNMQNGKVEINRFGIKAVFGAGFKKNLTPLIKFQVRLYKWLSKHNKEFDAIHACDFDTARIALYISKKYRKKLVYDIFDFYIDSFSVPKLLRNIIKKEDFKIINKADHVIICSEKRTEQIKGSKPNKLTVIHNTPPAINDIKVESNENQNNKIKIVYVGILGRGRFIEEIAHFVSLNKSNYEFHIAGFGLLQSKIEQYVKENENIYYYGKISYEEALALEKKCDVMTAIYTPNIQNHKFAAPNKFYEALMLGKPLIMVRDTGMDHIVSENDIGEVIDFDPKSFEEAITKIANKRSQWDGIRKRMRDLYETNYSWDVMEKRLIGIYTKLEEVQT